MHLVMRSSKARGEWSFFKPKHKARISAIITKHARKNRVRIQSLANVGNHLHLHIQLLRYHNYKAFIRAVTGAIALAVMGGRRRLSNMKTKIKSNVKKYTERFWDYRPFTIFINTFRHKLHMRDYMKINQLEGIGYHRLSARLLLAYEHDRKYSATDDG